jgi:hypothetical protein
MLLTGNMPRKFDPPPNILIDKGSHASADMTYIRAADIYLGDTSSQIYEFLFEPRPCVFLNSHGVEWENNPSYLHWALGEVICNVETELQTALERAEPTHAGYRSKQQAAFNYTFHGEPHTTAAQRGAKAIADFLNQ